MFRKVWNSTTTWVIGFFLIIAFGTVCFVTKFTEAAMGKIMVEPLPMASVVCVFVAFLALAVVVVMNLRREKREQRYGPPYPLPTLVDVKSTPKQ